MRPNILLITSDQQHWDTIGLNNPEIHTPNLDRLAKQGCLFDRAYCPNPTCTPTRASIITGMYPSQHGAYTLGTKLLEDRVTIGQTLSDAGYQTTLVGKAHFQPLRETEEFSSLESYPILRDLDFWRDFDQPFYGFDHVELARNHTDETHAGQHYAIWMEEKGLNDWAKHYQSDWCEFSFAEESNPPQYLKWSIPEEYHYNTWIAERSNALMEEYVKEDKPFFLWSSFFDPHPPYIVPEPWDTMYDPEKVTVPQITPGEHEQNPEHFQKTQQENPDFSNWEEEGGNTMHGCESHLQDRESLSKEIAVYYGMISCMDKYIGQILDKLDELGIADNTLIVFTSDHGHFFGHHGLIAKGPFHYEDLIRIPFIASWPGKIEAGTTSSEIQSLVDLAPTFLEATGTKIPNTMTGISQAKAWTGEETSQRDHAIVENRHQPTTINAKTYINARYKITTYAGHEYGELWDLENDPKELKNLWNDPASAELKAKLIMEMLHAEIKKEPTPMTRIAGA
ncbi:sulfatase family protein [Pelagicoccus mobilis]|uniref:Sulfatase-like hydrolase/transferase n=1 Tax=Pelagicoccus mobilis TaxID=415221 RepID=A0A934S3Z0_9BACT|nr:sulfatase-like hydrolase/transferase [Pelagicoccus mobilis]MBK1878964.1 sulfatase-like hydrolase/transferase [Pelagicoccus mobilis]